jgi:hypothetical protein
MLDAYHSGSVNENTTENKTLDRISGLCAMWRRHIGGVFVLLMC